MRSRYSYNLLVVCYNLMPQNICTTTAFNLEDDLPCDGHDADAVRASLADRLGIGSSTHFRSSQPCLKLPSSSSSI